MNAMRRLLNVLIFLAFWTPQASGAESCRLALVFALDVSGSVSDAEYYQQLEGLSAALDSPQVRDLILAGAGAPVHIAVFEWSSRNHQFLVQPWTALDSARAIDRAVARIRSYRKQRAGLKTALSTALLFAAELLRERRFCWQLKIDVSGDGKNNIGPPLDQIYALNAFSRVTINALVVGDPASSRATPSGTGQSPEALRLYYEQEVILGNDAFAIVAEGYEDYGRAMKRKLVRELAPPVLGWNQR